MACKHLACKKERQEISHFHIIDVQTDLYPFLTTTMTQFNFQPLPPEAFVSADGILSVNPQTWRQYLDATIQARYPEYALLSKTMEWDGRWHENDCIFTSIREYLLAEYCMVVPQDSLFKIYNPEGEGLALEELLEAISAVIEPLGFEVDRMLIPDDELRAVLNDPKVVDLSESGYFNGQAGIAMINIRPGYNHAFFWHKMDANRFKKEQFRLAVMVKPRIAG